MQYIYHMVPRNLTGNTLYPLNQLREIVPELYEQQVKKYNGREYLLARYVPKLKCLWNDVIQCAPVHPAKVYQAIIDSGFEVTKEMRWFRIPIDAITHPMAIYNNQRPGGQPDPLADDVITLLSPADYQELDAFPAATKAWYATLKAEGKSLRGIFHHCPHILIKGPIDISDIQMLSWA